MDGPETLSESDAQEVRKTLLAFRDAPHAPSVEATIISGDPTVQRYALGFLALGALVVVGTAVAPRRVG